MGTDFKSVPITLSAQRMPFHGKNMKQKFFSKASPYFFLFGVVLILSLSCFFIQKQLDRIAPEIQQENLLYFPSGRCIKSLTLGFNHLAADFLWIKAVVYFGEHYLSDQNYPWLYHILDIVTTLDPLFLYAYEFGGLILSMGEGNYIQSNTLLKKGIHYFPDYWRLYFYLGFNHFFYFNSPFAAAPYIRKAATLPGHPPYLPDLAASLYVASHNPELGIEFLVSGKTSQTPSKVSIKESREANQ